MPRLGDLRRGLAACVLWCLGALALFAAGAAQAKGTGLIFVSNEKGSTISVLDAKTQAVIRTVETCRRPRGMHFNHDRTLFYVGCADDDQIAVYDVASVELVGADFLPKSQSRLSACCAP